MPLKISKNPTVNWQNNFIQFPRLIAELESLGVFVPDVVENVAREMDLTADQVCELISRAQEEWDTIKVATS